MASGKARGIKRSSATTSYSSATTIVIFVGLSVLGLWLLTSNSFSPPQSTTRATATPPRHKSITHSHRSKPSISKVLPVHEEDIPVELPNDPVKSVDRGRSDDVNEIESTHDDEKDPVASSGEEGSTEKTNEEKIDQNEEQETKAEPDQNEEQETKAEPDQSDKTEVKISDEGIGEHEDIKELREKESLEEQEKQTALETQTSEESSVTQKQQVENVESNDSSESNQNEDKKDENGSTKADSSETEQHLITDEDQQRRIDEHQQREDDQVQQAKDPQGATSKDQMQHDEAPIGNETNAQVKNQEIMHDDDDGNKKTKQNKNHETNEERKESPEANKAWSTQADQSCLDNEKVISKLHSRKHHEHRERHCPEQPPTCLVPLPQGYKPRID